MVPITQLILGFTLIVGAAAPVAAATADGSDTRLRSILATRLELGPDADADARVAVDSLGPRAIPAMLRYLSGEGGESEAKDAPDLQLPECQAIVFDTLADWPQSKVVSAVGLYGHGDVPLTQKMVSIRVLGVVGRGRALGAVLGLMGEIEPMHLSRPFIGRTLEGALNAILERDTTALSRLDKRIDGLAPAILEVIARVLAADGRRRSIDMLAALLERDPQLDDTVLHEFASMTSLHGLGASERSRTTVRRHLNHDEASVRRTVVLALGRLHDVESYLTFVDLLEDENRRISDAALWSLRQLSGLRYDKTPSEWRGWFREQNKWLAREARVLGRQVLETTPGVALAASRRLASQRLYREECAMYLGPASRHPDQDTAIAICSALGRLATPAALEPLTEALDDPRAGVRRAAHRSLQEITGEALAEDVRAWQALIAR